MAFHAYVAFKGTKQGQLKGESTKSQSSQKSGWKNTAVLSFEFGLQSPRDASSGLPTGKRTHSPITIVREVDSASPLLWQALCTNEALESVKFTLNKPGSGSPGISFPRPRFRSIEVKNALITSIQQAPSAGGKRREKLTLAFDELFVNGNPQLVMPHYS
jgi:type VI secretion system secreted protein Hcp